MSTWTATVSPVDFSTHKDGATAEPLRAEVYGVERLEAHARATAHDARALPGIQRGKRLFPRLQENGARLNYALREFTNALHAGRTIPPAAEWLLDNYYVVETELNQVQHDLSANYYRELPKLADGPLAGYPRVLLVAYQLIAHTDSRLSEQVIERFVRAFQEITPLSTGEIWAVAIMLRILLIENLRRLMDEVAARYIISRKQGAFVILADNFGTEQYGVGFRKDDIAFLREHLVRLGSGPGGTT